MVPQGKSPGVESFLPLTDLAFNVLVILADETLHGYALIKRLRTLTGRAGLRTGTVYAALARLGEQGLVDETDPPEHDDPRRRYYRATTLGLDVARAEAARLREVLAIAERTRLVGEAG